MGLNRIDTGEDPFSSESESEEEHRQQHRITVCEPAFKSDLDYQERRRQSGPEKYTVHSILPTLKEDISPFGILTEETARKWRPIP